MFVRRDADAHVDGAAMVPGSLGRFLGEYLIGEPTWRGLTHMSGFIEVTRTDGLEPGMMREVEVEGHALLVARVGDVYHVTDARCPHLGGHLARGVLEGSVVTCPLHHSQFDLSDGSCLRWTDWKGAVLTVAELARHPRPLRAYDSKVEDGKIFVGPQKKPGGVPD